LAYIYSPWIEARYKYTVIYDS